MSYSGSDFVSQPVQEALDAETAARVGGILPNGFTAQNKSTIITQGSSPNDIGLDISSYTKCLHVKSRNSTATWADDIAIGVSNINMNNAWNVSNGGQVYQQMGLTIATGGIFLDNGGDMNVTGGGRYLLNGEPVPFGGDVTLNGFQTLTNKTIRGNVNTITNLPISATTGLQTALDNEATTRQNADTTLQNNINDKVSLVSATKQTITNALDIGGNVNIIGGGEFQIDGVPIGGGGGGDVTLTGVQTLTNKTMSANNNTFVNMENAIRPYSLNTTQVFQLDLKLNDRLTYYKPGIIQMRLPSNYEGPYVDAGLPFQVPLNIVLDRDNIFPPQLDYGIDPNGPDLIIYNSGTYEVSFTVSIEDAGRCRAFFECLTPFGNPTIKIEGNNTYIPSGSFGQMTGYGVFTIIENQSLFKLWLQCNGDGRFNPVFDGYNTDEIYATVVIHRLR